MKKYFEKAYNEYSFEFFETDEFPERELVTCVFAFVRYKGKIYLTKNHRGWELPGGHIEEGEDYMEALDREMAEEIGTKVINPKLFGYKKIKNFKRSKNRDGGYYPFPYSYILFYIAEGNGEEFKIDCLDTLDYGLYSLEEALELVNSDSTKKIIEIMNK